MIVMPINFDCEVRVVDLLWNLRVTQEAMENWIRHNSIPVPLIHTGRGTAVRVSGRHLEKLAIFVVLATLVGPTDANEYLVDNGNYFGTEITLKAGVTTARIDLVPIREIVLDVLRTQSRARHAA